MCNIVIKPFYGWVPHYFKTVLGGYITHTRKHSEYFLPFFIICLMLGNVGLNIYHTYTYYKGDFFYFSDTDTNITYFLVIFTGLGIVSLLPGFWAIGNCLLNIEENSKLARMKGEDIGRLRVVTQKKKVDTTSSTPDTATKKGKAADVLVTIFVLIFTAVCSALISSIQIHILYYKIIDCLVAISYTILATLIVGGFLLPVSTQYLTITNLYTTLIKKNFPFCVKPIAVILTLCVLSVCSYSVWLAGFSVFKLISSTQLDWPECGVKPTEAPSDIPPRLKIEIPNFDNEYSTNLAHLNVLLGSMDQYHKHRPIRCNHLDLQLFPYHDNCSEIYISAMFNSTLKTVVYKAEIEHSNETVTPINQQWYNDTTTKYTCGACLMRQAISEGHQNIPEEILQPCVKTYPNWLMYILYSYTGVIVVMLVITLVSSGNHMKSYWDSKKIKRKVAPMTRIVVDSEGNKTVLKKKKAKFMRAGRRR